MTQQAICNAYFDWMCKKVCGENKPFNRLLQYLHDTEFTYLILKDENRAEDGISLRYRFAYETGLPEVFLEGPCSVLEMMIALCIRAEETIMDDPEIGDRTGQWFWGMVRSLGLNGMYDLAYDEDYVQEVILNFLNRDYEPDGRGGLFTIRGCRDDLRDIEISVQRNWYLNTIV